MLNPTKEIRVEYTYLMQGVERAKFYTDSIETNKKLFWGSLSNGMIDGERLRAIIKYAQSLEYASVEIQHYVENMQEVLKQVIAEEQLRMER